MAQSSTSTGQSTGHLVKHIGLGHGVALYVGAILGAGVLVLPGQVATLAGPASLVSWIFACAMGVPLAIMFARLATAYPDAGGVATYVRTAFGSTAGGVTGWLYFVAGSVGQTIVPLTGGYYVAHAWHLGAGWAYLVAAVILAVATATNLAGLKAGARLQLTLAGAVAAALVVTVAISVPHMRVDNLTPFAPHGIAPIGSAVIVLFFAFAGWEAVGHLVGEFRDADRDVPKAVATTIIVVTVLYVGTAAAVVLTGTYGSPAVDRVAIGRLLQSSLGSNAGVAAAIIAVIISLGTTNAFVAGVSRLGYSLGRDGWLPRPVGRVSASGIPRGGIVLVATVAYGGLGVAAVRGWGTETLVVVPSTLVVAVYLLAAAAAVKLLTGAGRVCAVLTVLLTLIVTPSAAGHALIPLVVAALALLARALCRTPSEQVTKPERR